ncbi:hypothetical protein ACLMJK_004729 [Lecanora helva]
MARMKDLPNELMLELLEFVLPADLENFARISKQIAALSSSLLVKHRKLIHDYSRMKQQLKMPPGAENIPEILWLSHRLKEVQMNPLIGHYVRTLEIGRLSPVPWHDLSKNDFKKRMADHLDLFNKTAADSKYDSKYFTVCAAVCHRSPKLGEREYDDSMMLALLLSLLPNLNRLRMTPPTVGHDSLKWLFKEVYRKKTPILTRLREIQLRDHSQLAEHPPFAFVNPCAELRSLQKLSVVDWNGCNCREQLRPSISSNVSELELWNCKVNPEKLSVFLQQFHLRVFKYTCGLVGGFYDWKNSSNYSPIYHGLEATSCVTLRSLTCFASPDQIRGPFGSENVFGNLYEMCVDWDLLHLVDLPSSLRRLELSSPTPYWTPNTRENLELITRAKTTGKIQLEHLDLIEPYHFRVLQKGSGEYRRFKESCRKAEIHLQVWAGLDSGLPIRQWDNHIGYPIARW